MQGAVGDNRIVPRAVLAEGVAEHRGVDGKAVGHIHGVVGEAACVLGEGLGFLGLIMG